MSSLPKTKDPRTSISLTLEYRSKAKKVLEDIPSGTGWTLNASLISLVKFLWFAFKNWTNSWK